MGETVERGSREAGITAGTRVEASSAQVSCAVGGEAVILNHRSGVYHGLSGAGVRVWELLKEPRTVGEVAALLHAEYDVEPERCTRDLIALLTDLEAAGLVTIAP